MKIVIAKHYNLQNKYNVEDGYLTQTTDHNYSSAGYSSGGGGYNSDLGDE